MKELNELGLIWGKEQAKAQGWVTTYMMTVALQHISQTEWRGWVTPGSWLLMTAQQSPHLADLHEFEYTVTS